MNSFLKIKLKTNIIKNEQSFHKIKCDLTTKVIENNQRQERYNNATFMLVTDV